jgi:hypothetical protein
MPARLAQQENEKWTDGGAVSSRRPEQQGAR